MKKLLLALLLVLSLATGSFAQMGAPPSMAGGKLIDPVTAPSNGQVLKYNSTTGLWSPAADNTGAGGTITFDAVLTGANTTETLTMGTGGTLTYAGTGVINATKILNVTPVANALTLLGHDFATMRTDLGLVIGTNVQAYDADLDYLATFTPTANVKSILNAANYAAIRTLMDLGTTTGARLDYLGSAGGTTGTTSTNIVFSTSPTLVTPTLGAATATSINKVALTAPATGSTLTIADGKTLTISKTLQLTSPDDTTVATFPAGAITVGITGTLTNTKWCRTDGTSIICDQDAPAGAGTITAVGDITSGVAFTAAVPGKSLIWNNATSGTIELKAVTGALGTGTTVSLPATTGTIQVSPTTTSAGQVFMGTTTAGLGQWSTATYPLTTTANRILYSSATNTVGQITSGNSSVLVTDGSGVPSLATDIPTAVTIGTAYIYRVGGTDVGVTDGGTGRSTGTTAYALVATGTTATGAQQTLASGATTEVLVGGGAAALPVWTTATGTGAPVRAGSPTFTTALTVPTINLGAVGATAGQIVVYNATSGSITINPATGALASTVLTLPAKTGTVVTGTGTTNYAAYWTDANTVAGEAYLLTSRGGTGLGSYTAGDLPYYATGTAFSKLGIGSAGKIIRSSGTAPAYSTFTVEDTIALGSVFVANSANTLAAVTSTSGTKFLQNADGVISWQTGVGTIGGSTGATDNRLIRSDGTGGVTIQSSAVTVDDSGNMSGVGTFSAGAAGFTIDADGDVVAKSLTVTKASGVAGDLGLYEANSTDTDAAGFRGPTSLTGNTSYRGLFPGAKATSDKMVLAWTNSGETGTGTPSDPYVQAMSFIDLDTYLALAGGTLTGKLITATNGTAAGLNLTQSAADPSSPVNGDIWILAGGMYARIAGATVGPFLTGTVVSDTAYAGSWNGVTDTAPSKNAVYDKIELIYAGGLSVSSQAIGDLLYASSTTQFSRIAAVATGQVLVSAGTGTAPAWSASPTITGTNITGMPKLSSTVYAATTSAELAGVVSDEQGTGVIVFSDSPTFVDDITIAAAGVKLTGANGALTILGLGDGADEDVKIDLNTTANTIIISSPASSATDVSFSALNLVTTGTINGGIKVEKDDDTLAANQCYGTFHWYSGGAETITLPSAVVGMNLCVYASDATVKHIDPNGTDTIVLNGTALAAGYQIESPGAVGNFICLMSFTVNQWTTLGQSGVWITHGAD